MIKDVEQATQEENDKREHFEKEMNARWAENMRAIYNNTVTHLQELRRTIQSEETRKCIDEQMDNFKELAQMMDNALNHASVMTWEGSS